MGLKIILIFFILIFFLSSCNSKIKTYLPQKTYNYIVSKCGDIKENELEVYYLDGSCSFCIGRAIEIDREISKSKNSKAIFISTSGNPAITEYYFKENKIKGCLMFDKDSIMNSSGIKLNDVLRVSKDLSITPIVFEN